MSTPKNYLTEFKNDSYTSRFIDVIRGAAILIVILLHVRNFIAAYGVQVDAQTQMSWILFGAGGVGLFFFISGYLLNFLYSDSFNAKKYAYRRIGRIFPAWLFWNILAAVFATFNIVWSFQGDNKIMKFVYGSSVPITSLTNISEIIVSIIFMGWISISIWNSFVPGGWSIQAEMFHYTLYPAIRKIKINYILIAYFFITILAIIFDWDSNIIASSFITSPYWFISGILFSKYIKQYIKQEFTEQKTDRMTWIIYAGLTVATCMLEGPFIDQWKTLITVLICLTMAIVVTNYMKSSEVLFKKIGKYSYGMYFNHFLVALPVAYPVYLILGVLPKDTPWMTVAGIIVATFIIVTFISYFLAKVTYYLFEKRFIALSHKK